MLGDNFFFNANAQLQLTLRCAVDGWIATMEIFLLKFLFRKPLNHIFANLKRILIEIMFIGPKRSSKVQALVANMQLVMP